MKSCLQAVSTNTQAVSLGSQPRCRNLAILERAEAVLRAHLPDAVFKRIEAGLVEFVSEIRVCTILFIGFPSLKVALHASAHTNAVARCLGFEVCDIDIQYFARRNTQNPNRINLLTAQVKSKSKLALPFCLHLSSA